MAKHKPVANPQMAAAMREIRRSNAAGVHEDRRTRRNRSRAERRRKAVEDGRNEA